MPRMHRTENGDHQDSMATNIMLCNQQDRHMGGAFPDRDNVISKEFVKKGCRGSMDYFLTRQPRFHQLDFAAMWKQHRPIKYTNIQLEDRDV